jgi:cation diffusion facilitator CzcD-associated flavoprotein CzcO
MSIERVQTLVVGGGQAGLVMSHMLTQRGCPHLVLERSRIAERWRTGRRDGLKFQFPNWSVRLPDFPFPHADHNGFATTKEIVEFISAYAVFIAAPIRCGVSVVVLRKGDGVTGFVAETSDGTVEADNVVVATGPYQHPVIPPLLQDDASVFQVHASQYRNPDQLPSGAVLVVGSGASGAQITEELFRAGRRVYLSVGRHSRLPRRYRGIAAPIRAEIRMSGLERPKTQWATNHAMTAAIAATQSAARISMARSSIPKPAKRKLRAVLSGTGDPISCDFVPMIWDKAPLRLACVLVCRS